MNNCIILNSKKTWYGIYKIVKYSIEISSVVKCFFMCERLPSSFGMSFSRVISISMGDCLTYYGIQSPTSYPGSLH